jgi:hypothetical protein
MALLYEVKERGLRLQAAAVLTRAEFVSIFFTDVKNEE